MRGSFRKRYYRKKVVETEKPRMNLWSILTVYIDILITTMFIVLEHLVFVHVFKPIIR